MPRRSRRRRRYIRRYQHYSPSMTSSDVSEQTENTELVVNKVQKRQSFRLDDLESVNRITSIPIVETGWSYAGSIYNQIKKSNNLINWTCETAESSIHSAIDSVLPAVVLFQQPINQVDKIICKSLDIVEERVPSINLPPQMIYFNTKQYVSEVGTNLVRPVLRRADSVKEFGNTVLSSKYTAFAADTLDGALNVADKYVEKYLPAEVYDDGKTDEGEKQDDVQGPAGKVYHTVHHVDRFSRKLQRRLTKRTIAEAKALKEHSAEAVHVLIYVAELVVKDPKLALQKGKELWAALSKDEPENQAPIENLEQLIVVLSRESARRLVHFINFTSKVLGTVPNKVSNSVYTLTNTILYIADSLVRSIHLGGVQRFVFGGVKKQARNIALLLKTINVYITDLLENAAQNLQPQPPVEQPKTALEVPKIKVQLRAAIRNSNYSNTNANTVNSNPNPSNGI